MPYIPPRKILEKYADVLVNFALNGGKGIKKGETVRLVAEESAKPFYFELRRAILKSGGNIISGYRPSNDEKFNFDKDFYDRAKGKQIKFFPGKYMRGIAGQIDHQIYVISETNKKALKGVDPKKIVSSSVAFKPFKKWLDEKENAGEFTWTLGLYGTPAMAKEAGLSEKAHWKQIIKACFLDETDPVKKWREVYGSINESVKKLNNLEILKIRVKGPDVDLSVNVGEKRKWVGGSGRNIPSFEIFISPDWKGAEGWVKFNQPLYRFGNLIEGVELEFKDGKVVKAKAKKNEKILREIIKAENSDKIGEFSLTDARFSRITKFMAETVYDENVGGSEGNFHIALGSSYHDCYDGDPSKPSKKEWKQMGFNDSPIHTDIVSTSPRVVTATLRNGAEKVIYKNGQFIF